MTVLAWLLSLLATFYIGYHFRELTKKIEVLEETVKAKVDKKPAEGKSVSEIIDPLDEVAEAQYEHEKMMERLNPK